MKNKKRLDWIASSLKDLKNLPISIQKDFGVALDMVQSGITPLNAEPLKGFGGADVLELRDDFDRNTYRAVYTVRFSDVVYVLHVFQKKSVSGIKTPKPDMDLIRQRLKDAERDYLSKRRA